MAVDSVSVVPTTLHFYKGTGGLLECFSDHKFAVRLSLEDQSKNQRKDSM